MAGTVRVVSGAEKITSEGLVGATVESTRADYSDILNIPADATATVNGAAAVKGYRLKSGDELVFSRPLGQKGYPKTFSFVFAS